MRLNPLRLATAALEIGLRSNGANQPSVAAPLALVALAVICMAGAGAFAVAALTIYLIPIVGAAAAALIVAGTLITIACVSLAVSEYLSRRGRKRVVAQQPDLASLAAGAEGFIRENKALSLAAAFVGGLLVSNEQSKSD